MRRPAAKVKPRIAKVQSYPAPVHGWIANVNLAAPGGRWTDGSKLYGAHTLINYFPTPVGVKMRGGSSRFAVVGDGSLPVTSMFSYVNGNTRSLFASTQEAIYDITSPDDQFGEFMVDSGGNFLTQSTGEFLVIPPTSSTTVDGFTGGNWSVVQFATSGGIFLRAVNGVDTPLVFDGADWDDEPAITGATPEDLSYVWSYKNRLFFIEKDTLNAWYLPVDSIGGAAALYPLGGVFNRGGALMFGAEWSLDTGSGLSSQCVFVTTEGEVAVYQGSDPGEAEDFKKVGVYRIGKPRGPNAFIRAGGDLVIATDIGFVPLSQAIQRDIAALSPVSVSYPIEDAWNDLVADRTALNWECEVWPTQQMVAIAMPPGTGQEKLMLVANARTGAWTKYTGWGATCMEVYGDRMFFGTMDGYVIEANVTGKDQDSTYTSVCVPLFDPLKAPASLKTGLQSRVVYRSTAQVTARVSLQADYTVNLPPAPDDTRTPGTGEWGTGIWGTSVWGGSAQKNTFTPWKSTPGSGTALSPASQVTSGNVATPDFELVQTDLTYDVGDIGT